MRKRRYPAPDRSTDRSLRRARQRLPCASEEVGRALPASADASWGFLGPARPLNGGDRSRPAASIELASAAAAAAVIPAAAVGCDAPTIHHASRMAPARLRSLPHGVGA
jgi:hypothetical protein